MNIIKEAQKEICNELDAWKVDRVKECFKRIEQSRRDIERYEEEIKKTEEATRILENRGDRI